MDCPQKRNLNIALPLSHPPLLSLYYVSLTPASVSSSDILYGRLFLVDIATNPNLITSMHLEPRPSQQQSLGQQGVPEMKCKEALILGN
jgi:hypothetical protein